MNRFIVLMCSLSMFLSSARTGIASDDLLRERFEEEYPVAAKKLQEFYTNLRMEGIEVGEHHSKDWEYCGTGRLLRLVQKISSESEGGQDDTKIYVTVVDPDLSFKLEKDIDARDYYVRSMGAAPPEQYEELANYIRLRATAASAPYSLLEIPIVEFIQEKNFQIVNIGEEDSLIKVRWTNPTPDGQGRRGWFAFDPDAAWALHGYELMWDTVNKRTGKRMQTGSHAKVTYSDMKDGIPLVRKVQTWNSGPGGKSSETVIEVTKQDVGPTPEEAFTLAAFGIRTDPAPEPIPVMYYLLALSALCGLGAIVFRVLRRRSERSAASA